MHYAVLHWKMTVVKYTGYIPKTGKKGSEIRRKENRIMLEMKQLFEEAKQMQDTLVAHRRYLHQIPELSMDLPKTTA